MKSWVTLGAVVIIIAIVGVGMWVLSQPVDLPRAPVAAAPAAPAPKPAAPIAPPVAPAPKPEPVVVAPPVVAPPVPVAPVETPVAADAPHVDPTTDLTTALPDFEQMVASGDYITAVETYVQLPQGMSSQQFLAAVRQDPNFDGIVQQVTDVMRASKTVTPTFDDTGNHATYTFDPPIDGKASVRWQKVDGHWYFQN